jgi:hypothetical protein
MAEKEVSILGINPGTKYTGWAVFLGPELRDWGIKTLKGHWSARKIVELKGFIGSLAARYGIDWLAIKRLNPEHSSPNLTRLTTAIIQYLAERGIKGESRSIGELKAFFSPEGKKINREKLAELVAQEYPPLYPLLEREKKNRNSYYLKLFEAVALGALAYHGGHR